MTRKKLPQGVIYRYREGRGRPHEFAVRDSIQRRYLWETSSDYEKGLDWAKRKRREIDLGEATALAAPRTTRRRLAIIRAICHLAMKLPGRPLRFDPLRAISIPPIQRHDKPVFTISELRQLVSDESRSRARNQRQEVQRALEVTHGDKRAAASLLGCHLATVYNRLNNLCHNDPWWLYSVLAIYTGARPSEVQNLRWEWLHLDEEAIHIAADCPGNKMKLERIVPLQPELREILRGLYEKGMAGSMLPADIVRLDVSDRAKSFRHYMKRCGIPWNGRGSHSLRHNHGAISTAMRMHPVQVMLSMGHDNAAVSMAYARTAPRFRLDVKGWGEEFYLRRERPIPNLKAAIVIPSLPDHSEPEVPNA